MSSSNILVIAIVLSALLALAFLAAAIASLKKRKFLGTTMKFILALLMLSLAALFGVISISTQGYQALTREELAAIVKIEPLGAQKFRARISFTDGREEVFTLAGEQLYVDAHILKWKPIVNILGLHTAPWWTLNTDPLRLSVQTGLKNSKYLSQQQDCWSERQKNEVPLPAMGWGQGEAGFGPMADGAIIVNIHIIIMLRRTVFQQATVLGRVLFVMTLLATPGVVRGNIMTSAA